MYCCVEGCWKGKGKRHTFPKPIPSNEVLFKRWVYLCGNERLRHLSFDKIYVSYRVCSTHFSVEDMPYNGRRRAGCEPSQNLPEPLKNYIAEDPPTIYVVEKVDDVSSTSSSQYAGYTAKRHCLKEKNLRRIKYLKTRAQLARKANLDTHSILSKFTGLRNTFFASQLKTKNKSQRFTIEEKIFGMSLLKQNPSGYIFMQKFFSLPSCKLLQRLLSHTDIGPGLNGGVFSVLSAELESSNKINDKFALLMFDEMAIQPHLYPNLSTGTMEGFEDFGYHRSEKIANHVQVFIIRSVCSKWMQPVFFNFVKGATKKHEIVKIIKMIVEKCQQSGIRILATVCDQGSHNQAAIKILEDEDHLMRINGQEIVPLFDVPHLFKGIRNNFLNYDIMYMDDGIKRIAKWNDIFTAYKLDPYLGALRSMPKLTEEHVNPQKIAKMKMSKCTQVFSHTVAVGINFMAACEMSADTENGIIKMEQRAKDTAHLLEFFNVLFDTLNAGHSLKMSNKCAVTERSPHLDIWEKSLDVLKTMRFLKNTVPFMPPSQKNLIKTIINFKLLFKLMCREGLISMSTRAFNQDPIEYFFSRVRQRGRRFRNPTVQSFTPIYKSLLIQNFLGKHSMGVNCEDDGTKILVSLQKLITQISPETETTALHSIKVPATINSKISHLESNVLKYVCGYIEKKVRGRSCCYNSSENYSYIPEDEFSITKEIDSQTKKLNYFNSKMFGKMKTALLLIKYILNNYLHRKNIFNNVLHILKAKIPLSECEHNENLQYYTFKHLIKVTVFNYAKQINRILKGEDLRLISSKSPKIFIQAKEMYLNSKKR